MKKIVNIFLILFSLITLQNCSDEQFSSNLNYVSFSEATYSTGVDVGGTTNFDVTVFTSNISSSDRTFNVVVDPSTDADSGSYTVPATVTVPSGSNKGTMTVVLSDTNLGIGISKLVLKFQDVLKGYASGAETTVEYIQNCTEVTGTLDFTFDSYPEECGWYIEDALGGVVASKEFGTYAGKTTSSESVTLCAGRSYTIIITDKYGDGMFDGVNTGSYSFTIGGVVKASGGGNFGDDDSTDFTTN